MKFRVLLLATLASLPFAIQAQKISQLPAASALTGSELIPLTQAGGTVEATATQFANFIGLQTNDLTINGNWTFTPTPNGVGVTVNGAAASYAGQFNGSATSGSSLGVLVKAGTTSSDFALAVQNQAGTKNFFTVNGAGQITAGPPTVGPALLITGATTGNVINVVDNSVGSAYVATLNAAGSALTVVSPAATTTNIFSSTQSGQNTWALSDIASTNLLQLFSGAHAVMNWSALGAVTIPAPATGGGTSFTVNAFSSNAAELLNGGGSGTALLALSDTSNVNGANILLTGNGGTTPNKYIRANSGVLQFLNSTYTSVLMGLTDAGALSIASTAAQPQLFLSTSGGVNAGAVISAGAGNAAALTIEGNGNASSAGLIFQQDQSNNAFIRNLSTTGSINFGVGSTNYHTISSSGNETMLAPTSGATLAVGGISGQLAISATQPVGLPAFTVATLPACSATLKGGMAYVTDATSPTYNGTLTGSGAVVVPVFCNGASWTSH